MQAAVLAAYSNRLEIEPGAFRIEGFQFEEDLGRIFVEACLAVGEAR